MVDISNVYYQHQSLRPSNVRDLTNIHADTRRLRPIIIPANARVTQRLQISPASLDDRKSVTHAGRKRHVGQTDILEADRRRTGVGL